MASSSAPSATSCCSRRLSKHTPHWPWTGSSRARRVSTSRTAAPSRRERRSAMWHDSSSLGLGRVDVGVQLAVARPLPLVQCSARGGDADSIDRMYGPGRVIAVRATRPFLDERAPLIVAQPQPGAPPDPSVVAVRLLVDAFVAGGVRLRQRAPVPLPEC